MIKQIAKIKVWPLFLSAALIWLAYVSRISLGVPLSLLALYGYFRARRLDEKNLCLKNLALLFLIGFAGSYFLIKGPVLAIPFCLIPMLGTLLFNNLEVSLLLALAGSVAIFSLSNFSLGIISLVSGIAASILVFGARKRSTVIRAGAAVAVIQALTLVFLDRFWLGPAVDYLYLALNGLAASIIVL